MPSLEHFGDFKFPEAGLLATTRDRSWQGIAAELRSHPAGEVPAICPDHMEVTLAIDGMREGAVERRGDNHFQCTAVRPGTLWLCPIGVQEDSIRITAPLSRVLHLYLPRARFAQLSALSSRTISPGDIHYLADVEDDLLRQLGYRLLSEIQQETAGGSLLADCLANMMIAHLASRYSSTGNPGLSARAHTPLDQRRLLRVTDYIEDNIESDLTLAELAGVACLSPHHFARAFRETTGLPPHKYVSERRLNLAKHLLSHTSRSIADVAHACGFSSQTTFTRAFQRKLGPTPGHYRRLLRTDRSMN